MVTTSTGGVLVVDDDPAIRMLLGEMLQADGYQAQVAQNGCEALDLLDQWQPDLILLDLMMPVMDGWTFRQRQLTLRDAAAIPVVVLSAAHDAPRQGAALQAAAVVAKPFEVNELLDTVGRLVSESSGMNVEQH